MVNRPVNTDELMHYGVKGMRWGVRRAGPGRYLTKKRQLAGDKRDLESLNKGKHLRVGLTKKRQAAFDKRDKATLEKRVAKNEAKIAAGKKVVKKILSALTTPATSGPINPGPMKNRGPSSGPINPGPMKNRGPVKY